MSLADLQRRFLAAVSAPGAADDEDWDMGLRPGLAIYRSAYRARLIACMRATYPKCLAWAGDEAFDAAASHHAVMHPPKCWTLDALGAGFDATLVALFPDNRELAELAWLEWQMGIAFTSTDRPTLDAQAFAALAVGYSDADWESMRLAVAPELGLCFVAFDLDAIWTSAAAGNRLETVPRLKQPAHVAVWRSGLEPRFRLLDAAEAEALNFARRGMAFGGICAVQAQDRDPEAGARRCGAWLGQWIEEGLLAGAGASLRIANCHRLS